tara:strand:+ start:1685 stop:1882 length:198 start_codon:yes stop_codon:yes gene_type:complete
MEASTTKPIQTIQADVKDIQKDINDLKSHVKMIRSMVEQILFLHKVKKEVISKPIPNESTGWFWS